MSHIFISYSRQDKKIVNQYVESLRKQDFVVWQDVSNISAGEKWQQAIFDAIEQSAAMLVFWTQAASLSDAVKSEIDHAIQHNKTIIPIWLEKQTPLRDGLKEANALIVLCFSNPTAQKIAHNLVDLAPRIQRQVLPFDPSIPMSAQKYDDIKREVIGSREYVIAPLIKSAYSSAYVIAEAATIARQAKQVQLIIQNTGPVDYSSVRDAFKAILAADVDTSDKAEPLLALYVTGAPHPLKQREYWIDSNNVHYYSDMLDTTNHTIGFLAAHAVDKPTFQIFLKTPVDVAFLLGVSLDRWLPFSLYKWDGNQYIPVINISPRIPK